jgi:hypothetical protein
MEGPRVEINTYGSSTEKQPYGIGKTALTCVCTYSNVTSEMIPILLKAGADPNQRSHNNKGLPALICAIRNDNPKDFDKVRNSAVTLITAGRYCPGDEIRGPQLFFHASPGQV